MLGTVQVPSEIAEGGAEFIYCTETPGPYSCEMLRSQLGINRVEGEANLGEVSRAKLPGENEGGNSSSVDEVIKQELVATAKINAGQISLKVHFPFDVHTLSEGEKNKLAKQALQLRGNRVSIFGFTDAVGDKSYNDDLAQRRAQSVADFLAANVKGIQIDTVSGDGLCCYVMPNGTAEERKANRRAEVVVVVDKTLAQKSESQPENP